jgi:hypothetical protein
MPEPAAVSFSPQMEAQHGAGFGPARRTRSRSILLIQAGYFRTDHGILRSEDRGHHFSETNQGLYDRVFGIGP